MREASFIVRSEGCRLAYVRTGKATISFFTNGARQELAGKAAECAKLLADAVVVPIPKVLPLLSDSKVRRLVGELLTSGAIVLED